jgi:nucleoside-diphosphate-sugar epimerase
VLRIVCAVSDVMMHVTGKLSTLNNDHYNVLKQRNWRCDITPARRDFGFTPKVLLPEGVRRMLEEK